MHWLKRYSRPWSWVVLFYCIGIGIGVGAGYFLFSHSALSNGTCGKKYPLTSQELDCATFDDTSAKIQTLDAEFKKAADQYIAEGKATHVSAWVRDMDSRQWAAANEYQTYSPASLLKLPLMVAYFKYAQLDPGILQQPLVYQGAATDTTLYFTKESGLVNGKSYTIEQLIDRMMVDSDNGAANTLLAKFGVNNFIQVSLELGIKIPTGNNTLDFVTVKTYATIFRTLYNASYLNREYSQKALDIMTKSSFKGMADSVPKNTTVSHKFGERTVIDDPNKTIANKELHDCGLVYAKSGPYSLCIMTEGQSFDDLYSIIESLSAIAYKQLNQ
jgi:beta-lactamase class A